MLPDGNYIFQEVTTQATELVKKLKQDVFKSSDLKKLGIPAKSIKAIVLCFNSKLPSFNKLEEIKEVAYKNKVYDIQFVGLQDIALSILLQYKQIGKLYLGLEFGTGQIEEISKFPSYYSNKAQQLATPVDNEFFHREN